MNGYKNWRAASDELAEIVRVAGPRVALIGTVLCALAAAPIVLRMLIVLPGAAS
jgi:hypothetical protein